MPHVFARLSSVFCSLALGSACGPLVVLDDAGTGDETAEATETSDDAPSSSTSSTTAALTTTATSSTTSTTTSPPMTTSVDPTGDEPGYCAQACRTVADCLYPGSNPDDFECTDGFCTYVGEIPPCYPEACDDLMIGVCTEVDGVSLCVTPCIDDSSCLAGFTECTGFDDAGNSICMAIPCLGVAEGEACFIDGVGQFGVCTNGECACTDDSQCTIEGYACNG
jgi:hypothetical protein